MEKNETQNPSLKKEVVDRYFSLKILEAQQENEEELLHALRAARYLWQDRRQLDQALARVITRWDEDTHALNALADAPCAGPESLRSQTRRDVAASFRALKSVGSVISESFLLALLTMCLLVAAGFYLAVGFDTANVTGLIILSVAWVFAFVKTSLARRKVRR